MERENRRRCRIVTIREDDLLEFFGRRRPRYRVVLPELPDDYEIRAVSHRFGSGTFDMLVWSASFPETPDGAVYEWIGGTEIETIDAAPDEQLIRAFETWRASVGLNA